MLISKRIWDEETIAFKRSFTCTCPFCNTTTYRGYSIVPRNGLKEPERDIFKGASYQATGNSLDEAIRIVDAMEGD
jgi:hypothetical protein